MLHTLHAWTSQGLSWHGAALTPGCMSKKWEVPWLGSASYPSLQVSFHSAFCHTSCTRKQSQRVMKLRHICLVHACQREHMALRAVFDPRLALCTGKYRTAAVTDEGDIYMWEGWSKPAELANSRGPPTGDRVSQAMGSRAPSGGDRAAHSRPDPSSGSFSGQAPARRAPRTVSEDGGQQDPAAQGRRNRKSERAHALSERILPQR